MDQTTTIVLYYGAYSVQDIVRSFGMIEFVKLTYLLLLFGAHVSAVLTFPPKPQLL